MRADRKSANHVWKPLPPRTRQQCLGQVDVALMHGDPNEAKRAIDRAFEAAGHHEQIEFGSHIQVLALSERTKNALENKGIATVGALESCTEADIRAMDKRRGAVLGNTALDEIRQALAKVGRFLKDGKLFQNVEFSQDADEDSAGD